MKRGRKPYSTDPQEKLVRFTVHIPTSKIKRVDTQGIKVDRSRSEVVDEWMTRVIETGLCDGGTYIEH